MTAELDGRSPVIRRDGEGISRLWGKGSVVTTKLSAEETGGALGITHFSAVMGERAPRHTHTLEDEIFIVEGGEVVLTVGERTEIVNGAGVLFLPRGVPHSYLVESETARFYVITTPGGFERFFSEAGYPVRLRGSAPVGDAWSADRTAEFSERLGLGLIWGD
ncbi:MAG: cupin domain-containing protein [Streptomyces sp.]|uniref:cupin domain-containing protein n=1 Tax=Streptomyces sp. TaxID=1931 RepID=UPI0025F55DE1|nr:cupin domain-containing protein [Streptomyces sp.]MBW8794148.1 cupin domain-containing protein [Streptomyces sp.]